MKNFQRWRIKAVLLLKHKIKTSKGLEVRKENNKTKRKKMTSISESDEYEQNLNRQSLNEKNSSKRPSPVNIIKNSNYNASGHERIK